MPKKIRKSSAPAKPLPSLIRTDSETVVSNTAFLLTGQVVTGALSFILVIILARYLGNVGLGSYSSAVAMSALLMQLLDFGIPTYAVREIARRKEAAGEFISSIMGLRAVLSMVMVAGAGAIFFLSVTGRISVETAQVMGLAVIATALSFLAEPLRATLLAYEKHHYYAAAWIAERLIFIGLALGALLAGKGLVAVMAAFVISSATALLLSSIIVWSRFTKFTINIKGGLAKDGRSLMASGLPFWLSNLLMTVYSRIDTLMLSAMKGFAATGLYNAAYKVTDVFTFIPLAVSAAFYPTLSRLFKNDKEGMLGILYRRAFYYLAIIALPMSVALTLLAERLMKFLYASEFHPAAGALQILVWAELFIFMNYLMGYMLNAIDKQKLFTISTAIYAAANIILNLIMIPKFGYIGAAFVALTTQFMQGATLYYFCSKNGYAIDLRKLLYKPLVASAIMGAALAVLGRMHLLLAAPLAAITYLIVLAAMKGITKEDLTIVKGLVARLTKRNF